MPDDRALKNAPPFQYLITIDPLGLLYGSAGRFLSPENLVGRSGTHFPPSAATLSGLFAAQHGNDGVQNLQLAGPFWGWSTQITHSSQDFCIPTPMHCLVKMHPHQDDTEIRTGFVDDRLQYHPHDQTLHWRTLYGQPPEEKFTRGTWIKLSDWQRLASPEKADLRAITVYADPWCPIPHLHPYLKADERRVDSDRQRGSLFLENGVQLHPDTCLVYLANQPISPGWYRFGGEGHMVDLQCHPLSEDIHHLLSTPLGESFALITPAIWGSNRLSYREPYSLKKGDPTRHDLPSVDQDLAPFWTTDALLTERPTPYRYRLGHRKTNDGNSIHESYQPKLLSRGRYAVPVGSVYITRTAKTPCWYDWSEDWFPQEGPSLKRWGCGLALPLKGAIA